MGRAAKHLFPFSKRLVGLFALLFAIGALIWWVSLPDRRLSFRQVNWNSRDWVSLDESSIVLRRRYSFAGARRRMRFEVANTDTHQLIGAVQIDGIAFPHQYSADGRYLVLLVPTAVNSQEWQVIDTAKGAAISRWTGIMELKLSPDGSRVAIRKSWPDSRLEVYETRSKRLLCTVQMSNPGGPVCFSPDNRFLGYALSGWGGNLGYIADARTGKTLAHLAYTDHPWSRDSRFIVTRDDYDTLSLRSTQNWKVIRTFRLRGDDPSGTRFSDNGLYLGVRTASGYRVIDVQTGITLLRKHTSKGVTVPRFLNGDRAFAIQDIDSEETWELAPRAKLLARAYLRKITGQN